MITDSWFMELLSPTFTGTLANLFSWVMMVLARDIVVMTMMI
jgi:hypothetical protein